MPIPHAVGVPFLFLGLATAQGAMETVIPGRDFVQQKLLSPGLTDTWKLTAQVDEMLWCTVDSGDFDPVLDFVDAEGHAIASHDGAGLHSELWLRVAKAGDCEFRVRGFESRGGGHYQYRLHRFRTSPLGTRDEAAHTFGDEQWWHYRVALQEGDVLVPTVLGDGRLTAVLDDQRAPIGERYGGYRASRQGDCFVRVEGPKDRRCQVLTQLARRGERAIDATHGERITAYGLDTWRFPVHSGESLELEIVQPEVLFECDVQAVRPRPDGPALVATGQLDKGGHWRRLWFVRHDTELDVTLRHRGSAPAPYEITLRRLGATLRLGERVDGALPLGAVALYHADLRAGELVDVAAASEQFDARLDVWDPDGNVVARADDRSLVDRTAAHRWLVARPGTWHFLVYSSGAVASGAFTLAASSTPLPQIEVGGSATVQPGSHLHLALQTGETVWLSLRSGTFDAALQVVDPAGDASFVAEGGGVGGDVLAAYQARHSGRHTLLVHARSGNHDGELRIVRP
ncbi:MAG: hypothetical protein WAT39_21970 [Planctomycetota bacterium]